MKGLSRSRVWSAERRSPMRRCASSAEIRCSEQARVTSARAVERPAAAVDVKLHPNFSGNFTLPAVALHPKFGGITPKCRGVSFQLQWSCTEIQSIRYAEEYGAIE